MTIAPPDGFGLPAAAGDHVQIGRSPPSVVHMIAVGAAPYAQLGGTLSSTPVLAGTPQYTPASTLTDVAGNPLAITPFTGASSRF